MAAKSGTLGRIASKTMAAGRAHVSKVLKGEETLPEAAGAAVEDLLSGSKAKSESTIRESAKKAGKKKVSASKRPKARDRSARKKSRK